MQHESYHRHHCYVFKKQRNDSRASQLDANYNLAGRNRTHSSEIERISV